MYRTVEAILEADGKLRLLEDLELSGAQRVLVTLLEKAPLADRSGTTPLSETALSEDWDQPDEDEAWKHLQLNR